MARSTSASLGLLVAVQAAHLFAEAEGAVDRSGLVDQELGWSSAVLVDQVDDEDDQDSLVVCVAREGL